jgi:apolipoprotein N-acyltransferase
LFAVAAQCCAWFASRLDVRWRVDAIAVLCGGLLVLAFAPFNWSALAVLSPLGLLGCIAGASWKRAAWRGFLFGCSEFIFGIYWIYISVHDVGGAPAVVAIVMLLLLVAIMAAYSALACALSVRLAPEAGWRRHVLLFPALWVGCEWLRGWFLGGFPWLSLGYGQIDGPLSGYAPVGGVYLLSLCLTLSAGLLYASFSGRESTRAKIAALSLLVVLWLGGSMLGGLQWTRPAGPPIQVSLLQGDIPENEKWAPDVFAPTLERYRRLTAEHWDSRLVVWPEAAVPAYADEVQQDYLDPLEAEARKHGTDLLIGAPTENPATDSYYNSVLSLGSSDGVYNKRHLVIFGEFFPVPDWVRHWLALMDLPYSDFTAGAVDQPLLKAAGYAVGASICYEDAFGNEIMRALPKAAFLVNISNDGWFGDSIALPQHLEIARMRALEAGRYLLIATNTGITAIVDSAGAVRARAPAGRVYVLTGSIQPLQGATLLARWGNSLILGLCLLLLAVGIPLRRVQVRQQRIARMDPAK